MLFLKKLSRIIVLSIFIAFASLGLGFLVAMNPRSQYLNKRNEIELVEKKKDEHGEDEDENQE